MLISCTPWTAEGSTVRDAFGRVIATLDGPLGRRDARLIAAAPRLLAWVKAVMATDFTGLRDVEAKELIRKIEGGAPPPSVYDCTEAEDERSGRLHDAAPRLLDASRRLLLAFAPPHDRLDVSQRLLLGEVADLVSGIAADAPGTEEPAIR